MPKKKESCLPARAGSVPRPTTRASTSSARSPSTSAPSRWSRRWRAATSICTTCRRTRRPTAFPMTMAELDAYDAVHALRSSAPTRCCCTPTSGCSGKHRAQPPQAAARLGGRRRRPDDDRRLLLASRASTARRAGTRRRSRRCCRSPASRSTIGSRCPKGFAAELVEPEHPVLAGPGRRLAAAPRRQRGRAQGRRASCWPSCRTRRAAIRCWSPAPTARAAPSPGPRTSARTGCPTRSCAWDGYARLWRQSLDWLTAIR